MPGRHKGNGDMIACITSLGSKWDKCLGTPFFKFRSTNKRGHGHLRTGNHGLR